MPTTKKKTTAKRTPRRVAGRPTSAPSSPKANAAPRNDDTGLDQLDPATTPATDATHFRRIIAARKRIAEAEAELRDAVRDAHAEGNSWTVIGTALDTTRQAAFQRFGKA
ncbi:hypothetical protein ACFYO7_07160 [Nocardia salmonicida]|uniref:hypothetical protein n=1 Tax=Nocardia TaxID=1817 RepID=UPI0036B9BE8B